jgi:hypothetical protein
MRNFHVILLQQVIAEDDFGNPIDGVGVGGGGVFEKFLEDFFFVAVEDLLDYCGIGGDVRVHLREIIREGREGGGAREAGRERGRKREGERYHLSLATANEGVDYLVCVQ